MYRQLFVYILTVALLILLIYSRSLESGSGGIQGIQGIQGLQGEEGPQGIQGQKGDQGSAGQSFSIVQSYPDRATFDAADKSEYETEGNAIILISDGSLMVWTGTEWVDAGDIKGNQGEVGPQGIQGPQGPQGVQGIRGIQGIPGDIAIALQYASFYDLSSQGGTENSVQSVYCNYTLFNKGVVIVNSTGGTVNASRVKILNLGRYNLQFSLQLNQGNSSGVVNIWLRKNTVDVPYSNTKVAITANNPYLVAAWNFFVEANPNDFYEIIWSSTHASTQIQYLPEANSHPAVPSVILTIHQIGL